MRSFSGLHRILFLLVLLAPVAYAQKLEENTDRHGGDYRDFDLSAPDPLLCHKACVDDQQCMAFTYLKPDTGPGSPQVAHCWLKNSVPAAKSDPAFVSGVVRTKPYVPSEKPLPPGKPGEWKIERTSSGGIAPRHFTLSVTSGGHFSRSQWGKHEEGSVPPESLQKLNQAILAAKLTTWKSNYNAPGDSGCCDRVSTGIHLDVCGPDGKWIRYSGSWIAPVGMPADLEAVLNALNF